MRAYCPEAKVADEMNQAANQQDESRAHPVVSLQGIVSDARKDAQQEGRHQGVCDCLDLCAESSAQASYVH